MRAGEMRCALQREIVAFGGAGGEYDFARIGVDEPRHIGARRLGRRHRILAVDVALAVRIAEMLGEIGQHRLEHPRIDGSRRLIV